MVTSSTSNDQITGPDAPDLTAPDFTAQAQAQAQGYQEAGWWADFVAKWWGGFMTGIGLVIAQLAGMLDSILAGYVKLFSAMQATNTPGFFQLIASITSDLLGVEVPEGTIRTSYAHGGTVEAMRTVGGNLYDMLAGEFSTGSTLTPEGGLAAAKSFLGFLMSFAIRQGNVAFFTSMIPEDYRIGDGLREYGELMARNLGLGRMARRALQPLIQTLIADPLQWQLNRTYTPKTLGATQAIRAFNRGLITQDLYNQEIAFDGYNSERANALTEETLEQLSNGELYTLFRYGNIDQGQLKILLKRRGVHPVDADRYIMAQELSDADSAVSEMMATLKTQRLNGVLDDAALTNQLQGLPISQEYADRYHAAIGQELALPRRVLTVAELQYAYKYGMIDLDQFTARVTALGYSSDDVAFLVRDATVKNRLGDKHLSVAELQTAFVAGLVDLADFTDNLAGQGYSPDDAQLLIMLTLIKLDTQEAKVAVAQFKYDAAVAKAKKAGTPIPPPPPILVTGVV